MTLPIEYYDVSVGDTPHELEAWRRALVESGIATEEEGEALIASFRRQEAERLREHDERTVAKRESRRGFARLLNIGQ